MAWTSNRQRTSRCKTSVLHICNTIKHKCTGLTHRVRIFIYLGIHTGSSFLSTFSENSWWCFIMPSTGTFKNVFTLNWLVLCLWNLLVSFCQWGGMNFLGGPHYWIQQCLIMGCARHCASLWGVLLIPKVMGLLGIPCWRALGRSYILSGLRASSQKKKKCPLSDLCRIHVHIRIWFSFMCSCII